MVGSGQFQGSEKDADEANRRDLVSKCFDLSSLMLIILHSFSAGWTGWILEVVWHKVQTVFLAIS